MKLSISERVALLSVLPHEGNITNIRLVRKLREGLSFSEEELATHSLDNTDDGVRWDPGPSDPMKDVEIGEKAMDVVKDALRTADSKRVLTEGHIPIWDKFMGGDSD